MSPAKIFLDEQRFALQPSMPIYNSNMKVKLDLFSIVMLMKVNLSVHRILNAVVRGYLR